MSGFAFPNSSVGHDQFGGIDCLRAHAAHSSNAPRSSWPTTARRSRRLHLRSGAVARPASACRARSAEIRRPEYRFHKSLSGTPIRSEAPGRFPHAWSRVASGSSRPPPARPISAARNVSSKRSVTFDIAETTTTTGPLRSDIGADLRRIPDSFGGAHARAAELHHYQTAQREYSFPFAVRSRTIFRTCSSTSSMVRPPEST